MPKSSTTVKQRWNSAHYTQVKISVNPETAAAFKDACASAGCSMAGILSRYMAEYSQQAIEPLAKADKPPANPFATRKRRRRAVQAIIAQMEQLTLEEERYRDNIPENLQGSIRYEDAERCITVMHDVIELLGEIY